LSVVVSAPSPAQVQQVQTVFPGTVATTAVGPYYVTPSWPQQLARRHRFGLHACRSSGCLRDRGAAAVGEGAYNVFAKSTRVEEINRGVPMV
jgi:hypothetical protein